MTIVSIMVLLFLLGVLLNALYAAYETSFVSCNPVRVKQLAEKEHHKNARLLHAWLQAPDRILTVVIVATNLSLIFGTLVITRLLGEAWATVLATPMFLLFGEVVPKSMGRAHPTQAALIFAPFMRATSALLYWVCLPLIGFNRVLLYLAGQREIKGMRTLMHSAEDVRVLVDVSADHGAIEEEEKEMIHSVMDLQTRSAKEIMVPRIHIQALPEDGSRAELLRMLTESGRTRIPIYRDSIDEIIGAISAFDLLRDTEPSNEDIRRFIQPILHVHDTMKLDAVLQVMRAGKQSMAIVIDEYGGTDGLITLENILEEIFGDIQDEYDAEEAPVRRVGPNDFILSARTPIEEASEALGVELEDDAVETIGGWLMHATGRIPQKGEVLQVGGFRVTVLEGARNSIARIRMEVLPSASVTAPKDGAK